MICHIIVVYKRSQVTNSVRTALAYAEHAVQRDTQLIHQLFVVARTTDFRFVALCMLCCSEFQRLFAGCSVLPFVVIFTLVLLQSRLRSGSHPSFHLLGFSYWITLYGLLTFPCPGATFMTQFEWRRHRNHLLAPVFCGLVLGALLRGVVLHCRAPHFLVRHPASHN